jgi:glycosyltransferase 2 family protein
LVAVAVLLDEVGTPAEVWALARQAQWGWATVAVALSLATNVGYAIALMGTVALRLPLWSTTELEVATSYSSLVIPVVGGTGFQIRFLQRQGVDLASAITAGGLLSLAGTVITEVPLFAVALVLSPHELHLGNLSVNKLLKLILLLIFAVGSLAALSLGIPRLRRLALPPLREAGLTVWSALSSPRQLALLIGGNLVVAWLYGLCLLSCLHAFGGRLPFWSAMAISIGIGSLASLTPIPGGGTAVGAVGLTAALAGLGVPTEVAVATTLTNQLAVSYLPALPGWFATRHLLQRSDL